jgi:hypothetical protein
LNDSEGFRGNRTVLIVHHHEKSDGTGAKAEGKHRSHDRINDNVIRVGFSCFAIVLCIATITLDMGKHSRTECATPPGITHLFRVGAATFRTGCILRQLILRHMISSTKR